MELAELGFYKKKNGFEGAPDVLDFYNPQYLHDCPPPREFLKPFEGFHILLL
jgi:hypothetical protein